MVAETQGAESQEDLPSLTKEQKEAALKAVNYNFGEGFRIANNSLDINEGNYVILADRSSEKQDSYGIVAEGIVCKELVFHGSKIGKWVNGKPIVFDQERNVWTTIDKYWWKFPWQRIVFVKELEQQGPIKS